MKKKNNSWITNLKFNIITFSPLKGQIIFNLVKDNPTWLLFSSLKIKVGQIIFHIWNIILSRYNFHKWKLYLLTRIYFHKWKYIQEPGKLCFLGQAEPIIILNISRITRLNFSNLISPLKGVNQDDQKKYFKILSLAQSSFAHTRYPINLQGKFIPLVTLDNRDRYKLLANYFTNNTTVIKDKLSSYSILPGNSNNYIEILMILGSVILSINILIFTIDMLTFYISIELFSFTSFFLILLKEDKLSSINAFIYFIINTISSIIILLYFFFIYKHFGFLNFSFFDSQNGGYFNSYSLALFKGQDFSFLSWIWATNYYLDNYAINYYYLFFLGFIIKLGLAPFHFWILPLYNSINPKITFYISTIPKIIYLFILLKFLYLSFSISETYLRYPLVGSLNGLDNSNSISFTGAFFSFFIFFSLIFSSYLGLNTKNIIKLFASSSIFNSALILLFLLIYLQQSYYLSDIYIYSSWSVSKGASDQPFLPYCGYSNLFTIYHYIILYIINIYNFFYILLIFYNLNYVFLLKDLKWSFPFLSFILFISILSFIGIPPLSGFFNKIYLFINSILSFNLIIYFLLFMTILFSIINTNFYLYFIKFLLGKRSNNYKFFSNQIKFSKKDPRNNKYPRSPLVGKLTHLPLTLSFLFILFYPLFSSNFYNIINLFIF